MIFHMHHWTEAGRKFNAPTQRITKAAETSENVMQIVYGMTVVELHCERCGDVKGVRYAGTVQQ